MSTWLAFDAGSPVTSAAVARDGALLAESSGESRSGPPLLYHLDETLRRSGLEPAELDGILALRGPGSFTGIRVTLATALGLRDALGVRVAALSNLAALALHAFPDGARMAGTAGADGKSGILALVDALRDEWFVQEFRPGGRGLVAAGDPTRVAGAAIAATAEIVLAAHASQGLPAHLARMAVRRASALSAAVATASSAAQLDDLISDSLQPLYLRAFALRSPPQ